jgi:ubiquitin-protein ligase
VKFLVTACLI